MSGQALLGDARAFARSGWLPARLTDAALSLCDERLLQFLYEAGCDAGLSYRQLMPRVRAITFQHAAIQLSDDLSDGECRVLDEPARFGPLLLVMLQNAFTAALSHAGVSSAAQRTALAELAAVGRGQLRELGGEPWDLAAAQYVASRLNGNQLSAYLRITWDGTTLAEQAGSVGMAFGRAVHVATDIASRDARWRRLTSDAQTELARWAAGEVRMAQAVELTCLRHRADALLLALTAEPLEST